MLGTDGYVEVGKNVDAGNPPGAPCVILVNASEERMITFDGSEPFPFFGRMILDCLHRTENAISFATSSMLISVHELDTVGHRSVRRFRHPMPSA